MATLPADVTAAMASLQARWGAAAPRVAGMTAGGEVAEVTDGALALAPATALAPASVTGPGTRSTTPARPGRSRHPHRLCRTRCDPGARRPAQVGQRRDPWRRLERPDDARPPARRRSPGRWLDRRLARPLAQLRPGRGGRPWRPAGMARGHHARDARRGAGHRWRVAGRSIGGPARAGPARWPAGHLGPPGPDRRSAGPAGGPRPAGGDAPRRARTAGSGGWARDRRRRIDRRPSRARQTVVDPARTRHRRAADRGARRPQSLRPAGEAGDAPDPLRRRRRTRHLPPSRRPPHRSGPRHPSRTDPR